MASTTPATTALATLKPFDGTSTITVDDLQAWDGSALRRGVTYGYDGTTQFIVHPAALYAVTGLVLSNGGSPESEITLVWDAPAAKEALFTEYRVERAPDVSGSPGTWAEIAALRTALGTETVTDTGRADDTKYWYRVYAYYDGVLSEDWRGTFSTQMSHTTVIAAPTTAPLWTSTFPKDDVADDDSLLGDWGLVTLAATYQVMFNVGSDFDPDSAGAELQDTSATTFDHSGHSHGDTIYYYIRGRNAGGDGPWSLVGSATVSVRAPGAPGSVTATEDEPNKVDLSWTAGSPNNETLYRIQSRFKTCGGSYGSYSTLKTVAADVLVENNIAVLDGRVYQYRVRAENAGGNSSYTVSNEATISIASSVPTGLSATFDATNPDSEGDATWNASTGSVDGYDLRYRTNGSGGWTELSGVTSPRAITGLADDTEWEVQVRSFNNCDGDSSWSGSDTFWTAPGGPTSLSWSTDPRGKQGTDDTIEYVAIGTDADTIEVYYISGTSGTPDENDTLGGATQTASLSVDSPYRWRFRARMNASGGSPHGPSDWVWVATTKQAYTHVDAPQITGWNQDDNECPSHVMDLTVEHNGAGGNARTDGWEWRERINSGSWSSWSAKSGGTTTETGIDVGGSALDTANVETRYQGESPTDTNGTQILCQE